MTLTEYDLMFIGRVLFSFVCMSCLHSDDL